MSAAGPRAKKQLAEAPLFERLAALCKGVPEVEYVPVDAALAAEVEKTVSDTGDGDLSTATERLKVAILEKSGKRA